MHSQWLFEIKWDGYRALCTIEKNSFSLVSRNGLDVALLSGS